MISFSTIIGVVVGVGLFVMAIDQNTDNFNMFLSSSSLLMVLGGTFAASLISFTVQDMVKAIMALLGCLRSSKVSPKTLNKDVARFVEWARMVRADGVVAVEKSLSKIEAKDHFISFSVELLGSGYKKEEMREILEDAREAHYIASTHNARIMHVMGAYAPGFGMIGTVIGLIIMLDNMDGDTAALGKGLALALITTLYGVLLAQLLFKPAGSFINLKADEEYNRQLLFIEGILMLKDKADVVAVQDRLNAFLPPRYRYRLISE